MEAKSCRQCAQQSFNYIILSCHAPRLSIINAAIQHSTFICALQDENVAKITYYKDTESNSAEQSFFARSTNVNYVCFTGCSLARNESSAFTAMQ